MERKPTHGGYIEDVAEAEPNAARYGDAQVLEANGPDTPPEPKSRGPVPRGDAEACRPGCAEGCCPTCRVGGQSAAYYGC